MTGERILPNLGLTNKWTAGSSGWAGAMDADLALIDALVFLAVLDNTLAVPPGSPAAGDRYVVATGASGAWAGQANSVAVYVDAAWVFYAPRAGWTARVVANSTRILFNGSAWVPDPAPYDVQVFRYTLPVTPEPVLSLVMSRAVSFPVGLTGSRATAKIAPTGAVTMSIMRNTTALGTINFAAAATLATLSFTSAATFAAGDILEILPPTTADATLRGFRVVLVGTR